MAWQKRLARDMKELNDNKFEVLPDDGTDIDMHCFRVKLVGPKDTPYENHTWHIRFTVNAEFPFKSPSVGFVQHILHPNIDWSSGSVCLDALNAKWSPSFTLCHIMDTLLPYLLTYPNPEDPLNREAAELYLKQKNVYMVRAAEATKKFALKDK